MMLRMNRAVSGTPWYRDVVSRKSVYRWKSSFAAPFDFSAKSTSVRAGPTVVSSSGAQEEAPFIARPSFLSTEGASTQLNSATFMAHEAATSNNTKFDPSKNIEDDGYGLNRSDSKLGWLKRFQQPPDPGTLILVRHGESEWNRRELFTGWVDVDLSQRGVVEIEHASRLLMERGYTVDITYTSMLKRAIRSSWIILNEINQIYRPIIKSWRLNERMYGALEGHSKPGLAKVFGKEIVQQWRAGLLDRPPEMNLDHIYWHGRERKYAHLHPSWIPRTESLQDTIDRVVPLWDSHILPDLKAGRNVMIVAHCNSLRGIVKHIDGIGTDDIQKMGIPNGIPLVYKFDKNMKPVQHKNAQPPLRGIWLEKKGLLRAALDREAELAEKINGFENMTLIKDSRSARGFYNTKSSDEAIHTTDAPTGAAPHDSSPSVSAVAPTPNATISTTTPADNTPLLNLSDTAAGYVPQPGGVAPLVASVPGSGVSPSLIKGLTKLEFERKLLDLVDDKSKDAIEINRSRHSPQLAKSNDEASLADIYIDRDVLNSAAFTDIPCNLAQLHGIEEGVDHVERFVNVSSTSQQDNNNQQILAQLNYLHFFRDRNDAAQGLLRLHHQQQLQQNQHYNNSAESNQGSSSQTTPVTSTDASASSTPTPAFINTNTKAKRDPVLEQPLLVIIRHGKTEHNQLGLFTGWEDALLATEGRDEAIHAGKLLRRHGIEFDVVYTSWLSRAIETAWLVLNELDSLWLPVVKTWRLNERMYGALTGLSKKMIRQIYGDEQFMKWRRGFDTSPPPISSFSHAYPGNDTRYVKYVTDVDVSFFETAIRSLAHGKLEIHRNFPKAESLKDCMERTIPYFRNTIVPESIEPNKHVLIASSENAIRGLLMHLCDIPQDKIPLVEIPTGLPLIYDATQRKIRLLQDGALGDSINPLKRYNFGLAPELLFDLQKKDNAQTAAGKTASTTTHGHAQATGPSQTEYIWDRIVIRDYNFVAPASSTKSSGSTSDESHKSGAEKHDHAAGAHAFDD